MCCVNNSDREGGHWNGEGETVLVGNADRNENMEVCRFTFDSFIRRLARFMSWSALWPRPSNPGPHSMWRTSRSGTNLAFCVAQ